MKISIVVRTHNDIPYIAQTLQCLQNQQIDAETEIMIIDNESTDGTSGVVRRLNSGGINLEWPAGGYVPGKVLNFAVSRCSGDYIVFNNADSVPQNEHYLSALLRPLLDGSAQIVYAQQIPRKDARPLIRKDYRRAFGDGSVARTWRHFFSIAAAAAPRKLLKAPPFREDLQYSEDVEWSWRMKQQGCRIAYAEDATVEHSHNYDLKQTAKRFYNEGIADAMIFRAPCGFFGTFLLPLCRELLRDISFLFREHELADAPYELTFRILQRWNHYRGYRRGESCRE